MKNPQGEIGRIIYITEMMNEIEPTIIHTPSSKIRGTTIEKLCQYDGPGYKRVKAWCEEHMPIKNIDMDLAKIEYQKCFDLMKGRNAKYGDSWKVLTIQSIANLCEMKLHRIANMAPQGLDPKIEDELRDTANYMIFALLKLNKS